MGCILRTYDLNWDLNWENDDKPVDLGVSYFQTSPGLGGTMRSFFLTDDIDVCRTSELLSSLN
jgi:hypothetical protein